MSISVINKKQLIYIAILFILGSIISVVANPLWSLSVSALLIALLFTSHTTVKPTVAAILTIVVSNVVMTIAFSFTHTYLSELSNEWRMILNRLVLIFYCIVFIVMTRVLHLSVPKLKWGTFKGTMNFPLIWFKPTVPIWSFIVVGITSNLITYLFFIDFSLLLPSSLPTILLLALIFSLVNAVLEEVFWRGLILQHLVKYLGSTYGLIMTSIAFGIYHYSFGMPWYICLFFIVGGLYMGDLALKAKGLFPVILFHFVLNFGMFMLLNYS